MTEQPSTEMTAMSHETTGFCFCGQMHGPVKDWNGHDWAALRTHAPAGALSAQSVSLPTREQIAEAHRYQEGDAGDGYTEPREWWAQCSCGVWLTEWQQFYNESDDNPHEVYALHLVDAVLALLSQPTPTAEPDHPRAQPIGVIARSVVHSLLTAADSNDIALWEDYPEIGENDWDEVIAAARALAPAAPSEDEYRTAYAVLDPSTIRDVTPPPTT